MTRNELIKVLKDNCKPSAQMDFLLIDRLSDGHDICAFIDIKDVGMNVDVDDPKNRNRGGIVFKIKEELIDKNMISDKYINKMKSYTWEGDHDKADDLICDFLEKIGYQDLADAYRKVPKWFA